MTDAHWSLIIIKIQESTMENVMEINVLRLLEKTAQKYGDKTAYSDTDNSITFAEIEDKAKRMGSALAEKVTPRSPIAVMTGRNVGKIMITNQHLSMLRVFSNPVYNVDYIFTLFRPFIIRTPHSELSTVRRRIKIISKKYRIIVIFFWYFLYFLPISGSMNIRYYKYSHFSP